MPFNNSPRLYHPLLLYIFWKDAGSSLLASFLFRRYTPSVDHSYRLLPFSIQAFRLQHYYSFRKRHEQFSSLVSFSLHKRGLPPVLPTLSLHTQSTDRISPFVWSTLKYFGVIVLPHRNTWLSSSFASLQAHYTIPFQGTFGYKSLHCIIINLNISPLTWL